ncbi:tetratricopeptide repeat domain-containing protein [Xylaria venustula]|nr:tetratricopeptide repeat domain-containing protein [Xylaria venustula]
MDVFSVVTGAAGLLDICTRVVIYVKELKNDGASIQEEVDSLMNEVVTLQLVHDAVSQAYNKRVSMAQRSIQDPTSHSLSPKITDRLWEALGRTIKHCHAIVERIYNILQAICEPSRLGSSKGVETISRVYRKRSKEEDLRRCERELTMHHYTVQMFLTLINREDTQFSLEDIATQLRAIQSQIISFGESTISTGDPHYDQEALLALQELKKSIVTAVEIVSPPIVNEHFHTPQTVSSIFTGREQELQQLKDIFIQSAGNTSSKSQRRFVIHGLSGSGKTQFCCKFAEDTRHNFWGVFCIDGSSVQSMKKSLGDVAKLAGRDPNSNAAIDWLSTVEKPWLLLIDNADDAEVKLEDYFPRGTRGHILITTRNQGFRVHGNIGPMYYNFSGLQIDEASTLLLKATCLPFPWESNLKNSALKVTEKLGCLALAIVQAGAAIRQRLCHLHDYLGWYDRSWNKLRAEKFELKTTDSMQAAWVTFEMSYERLEEKGATDAIDLLNIFAFFYRENISPSIFTRALKNAQLEFDQEAKAESEEKSSQFRKSWSLREDLQSKFTSLIMVVLGMNTPIPLPSVVRDGRQTNGFEMAEDRIRCALSQLENMALISYNEGRQTYTIHPMIHDWLRKRPRMKIGHQILWADMAAHVLSASILLPPLGTSPEDELYNATLLPHIEHVQKCRTDSNNQLAHKMSRDWFSWLAKGTAMKTKENRIHMFAKFSLIYAQCWQLESAEALLKEVVSFLAFYLGLESNKTRTAQMALSNVYREQGNVDEALRLQESIVATCKRHFGDQNPDTLRATHQLSNTLWLQGRYSEAKRLQVKVVDSLTRILGRKHKDTLEAIDDLGRTVAKFWRQEDLQYAFDLYSEALEGMKETFGTEHLRTTYTKENLARLSCILGDAALVESALQLMDEVIATRKARMGKEAAWTLMAMGNRAVVLAAQGQLGEAEVQMQHVLHIAKRNIKPDHIGVLFGRQALATILIQQKRYKDAEEILLDVARIQKNMPSRRGDYHPERIASLIELARCSQLQGDFDKSIELCDEVISGLESIAENAHPFTQILTDAREQMLRLRHSDVTDSEVKFPEHLFKLYK